MRNTARFRLPKLKGNVTNIYFGQTRSLMTDLKLLYCGYGQRFDSLSSIRERRSPWSSSERTGSLWVSLPGPEQSFPSPYRENGPNTSTYFLVYVVIFPPCTYVLKPRCFPVPDGPNNLESWSLAGQHTPGRNRASPNSVLFQHSGRFQVQGTKRTSPEQQML